MFIEDGTPRVAASVVSAPQSLVRTAQVRWSDVAPLRQIQSQIGNEPLASLTLFVTPHANFEDVTREANRIYPDIDVIACTTAGEIGENGYDEGLIVAVGFPAGNFSSSAMMIKDLSNLVPETLIDRVTLERVALCERAADMEHGFAFLVIDGLSLSEDMLANAVAPVLHDMPIFGGSAGDGTDFRKTLVSLNGEVATNAAVLNLVRSHHLVHVFSLDHLVPSEMRMVVTEADPVARIVKTINAEPAAREYARIVGKDPDQLDRFTFASHPVAVRIGDSHHVRAIQQVNEAGELVFYSAIDEGMVLTVATADNMAEHLITKMNDLARPLPPDNILVCDCILRRIEAEQTQTSRLMSDIMSEHKVTGFSTYGEQIGPLHVNHTMSGVAFYRTTTSQDN
ncbi:MAG: FIST N-terminal domain-containing protein [Litoreibacter sp.]